MFQHISYELVMEHTSYELVMEHTSYELVMELYVLRMKTNASLAIQ